MSIDTNVTALVSNITQDTDKGYTAYSMLPSEPSLGDVQHIFSVLGLRWNQVVEQDAINALNDYQLAYFTDRLVFAEQALSEMYIYPNPPTGQGAWHVGDMGDYLTARYELAQAERAQYGVSVTSFLDNEWACPREQERFYKTDAWRRCSAAQRYMWDYKCRRCGAQVRGSGGAWTQILQAEIDKRATQLIRLIASGWQPPVPMEVRPAPVPETFEHITELDRVMARGEHRWREAAEREEGYKEAAKRARWHSDKGEQMGMFEQEGL